MKAVLQKFINEHLFDASASLLEHLHIQFTAQSKSPLAFTDLYPAAVPASVQQVVGKLQNIYLIGAIDEETLAGRSSDFDIALPLDGKYATMLVFAVEVKPGENFTRSELATLTRGFNRMAPQLPVILFVKNGDKLTLATCERSNYKQEWREGEKLGKVSILRDIDCNSPHRGHIDILETLGDKAYPSFDDLYSHWLEVFSSELLTKKFYTELSEWYAWVISSGKVKFPNDITTTEDDTKFNHEAVIRLITRLIFVWFLKQKHLIPEEFFDEKFIREHFIENFDPHSENTLFYDPSKSKYYRLILQNLFFAMLNRPIKDEDSGNDENRRFATSKRYKGISPDYNINNLLRYQSEFAPGGADLLLKIANSKVPFLNGGLFECLDDKENKCYYDGFSEHPASLDQLAFPDYFFFGDEIGSDVDLSAWYDDKKKNHVRVHSLINILNHYNFTVEENTPLDQEVSLDPELLGKVFENLLASYNPETNTSARKQTGSFYTPREIVQYMVNESIIAYLRHSCPDIEESVFRNLFDYSNDSLDLPETDRSNIITALYNCKVLDPACGSGAFPMGVLQQMVHALRKLDPTNEIWREFILNISLRRDKEAYQVEDEAERNRLRADIEQSFNRNVNDPDYARKLYLIENCIYGVDIQSIAVQISKLRFFISLVAEQKPTKDASQNFGVRPLPNLEAKFVSANSLISLGSDNLFTDTDKLKEIKKHLLETNHKLFNAKRNAVKKKLKQDISDIRQEYANELEATGAVDTDGASMLANWDMFNQNASAQFFDSQWMFGVEGGFDIVIGNPPYIQLQKSIGIKATDKRGREYEMKLGDLYENESFKTFAKTGDIYCLFYEQGAKMLKPGGHLCFITSNKWMRAGYGEKLRSFFANETNPEVLIDFGGIQVFETATVDTNILLFSRNSNKGTTKAAIIKKENYNGSFNLSDFVRQNAVVTDFATSDSWVILSPIEQSIKRKIEAIGTPLKDWDIQINYGIKTGYNEAFIITTEKRDEILSNCADDDERRRTDELIRPILRGRDIKRYGYDWAGLWLIATFPAKNYDIEQYPAVKDYLLSFAEPMLREAGLNWVADDHLSDYCHQKLAQTGQYIEIAGQRIRLGSGDEKARKKTSNKWFETQDSISYWDDFSKPKIVYQELCRRGSAFSMDFENNFLGNTGYLLTSNSLSTAALQKLCTLLNSQIALYQLDVICTKFDETGWRWLRQFIEEIRLPTSLAEWRIAFGLTAEEINFISSKYIHVLPD